jgi:hypothetical protein
VVAEPAWRDVRSNQLLGRTDSRVVAAALLEDAAGDGTHTVYQTGAEWGHLQLWPAPQYFEEQVRALSGRAITPERQIGQDYERLQAEARRDEAATRRTTFVLTDTAEIDSGARPEYIVMLESELRQYSELRPGVRDLIEARYEVIGHVEGAGIGAGWYDQHDAFYLPFIGFGGVTRPGPDVTILRRNEASPPP